MKNVTRAVRGENQQQFCKLFDSLCGRYGRWTIWSDFVVMAAISIANTVDCSRAPKREQTYMAIAKKYKPAELNVFAEMLTKVVLGMEVNSDQDFLGELFMALGLGNDHAGQFFTPYNVCRAMSQLSYGPNLADAIEKRGWISVNDPACGAGALLVAFANECTRQHINYQTSVLFVAQDIDYTVGLMCYIQLSLLGCPGYVVIGDSLLHPSTSIDSRGLIPHGGDNVWLTPFYCTDLWSGRRLCALMDLSLRTMMPGTPNAERLPEPDATPEPPKEVQALPKPAPEPLVSETATGQLSFF